MRHCVAIVNKHALTSNKRAKGTSENIRGSTGGLYNPNATHPSVPGNAEKTSCQNTGRPNSNHLASTSFSRCTNHVIFTGKTGRLVLLQN